MSRNSYYRDLKELAREKRGLYNVATSNFGLREVRKIYQAEGVRIDYWPLPYKIKALYMCSDGECSVAIQRTLPDEPKLFALMHELKHHYVDREAVGNGVIHCGDYNANEALEIGAEIFAAEFIYPELEFSEDVRSLGLSAWRAEDVVRFKRDCKAKVSFAFICKRLEWLNLISQGQFASVQFQKLDERMFGIPFYRRRKPMNVDA